MDNSEFYFQFKSLPREEQAMVAAQIMGSLCNSFSMDTISKDFIQEMNREHRTIQQAFTKMMFQWIEHVSSDNYRTDLRNEDSKKCASIMVDAFKKEKEYLPSEFLRMI